LTPGLDPTHESALMKGRQIVCFKSRSTFGGSETRACRPFPPSSHVPETMADRQGGHVFFIDSWG
jgi:hypothetical protein